MLLLVFQQKGNNLVIHKEFLRQDVRKSLQGNVRSIAYDLRKGAGIRV